MLIVLLQFLDGQTAGFPGSPRWGASARLCPDGITGAYTGSTLYYHAERGRSGSEHHIHAAGGHWASERAAISPSERWRCSSAALPSMRLAWRQRLETGRRSRRTYAYCRRPNIGKTLTIQLAANGNQSAFDNVRLDAVNAVFPQVLPQFVFGGGWYTALYFTNLNASPASFTVNFIGNDGNPLTVPSVGGSSVSVNLVGRGSSLIEAPDVGSLVQGYVSMTLPAGVTGYGVFRQSIPGVNDQEAVVLLSGTTATTSTLEFDDTKYVTGAAVVNLASVGTTISVIARDNQGNAIGTSVISLQHVIAKQRWC